MKADYEQYGGEIEWALLAARRDEKHYAVLLRDEVYRLRLICEDLDGRLKKARKKNRGRK